jgi:hypothetical protein
VAYLTAWPTKDGVAAFRQDIYEMDDTDFVTGQPLPVGESQDGLRYVLKPIPRLQEDIDTDNGFSIASIFRPRNGDKNDVLMPGWAKALNSLTKTQDSAGKPKENGVLMPGLSKAIKNITKTEDSDGKPKENDVLRRLFGSKNDAGQAAADPAAKKKLVKKPADGTAKAAAGKDKAKTVTTAKAGTQPEASPPKPVAATASAPKAPEAPAPKPAATETAKFPVVCNAGTDGKLPAGCPAPILPSVPDKAPAAGGKTADATN